MDQNSEVRALLDQVRQGNLSVDQAMERLRIEPFEDLGYAKVDHHREVRQGAPEVIYGASKTKEPVSYTHLTLPTKA